MEALELRKFLIERPPRPFRLNLADGSKIDVRFPKFARLSSSQLTVNVPERDSIIIKDYQYVPVAEVVSAEFIETRAKGKRKAHAN